MSETFAALIVSLVTVVGVYILYLWQKEKDRQYEILKEQREIVAKLIAPIEECAGHLSNHLTVFSSEIPHLSEKMVELRKAMALVRVYEGKEVADQAEEIRRKLLDILKLLRKEKSLRPPGYENESIPWGHSPKDYKEAQTKTREKVKELNEALDVFYEKCGTLLNLQIISPPVEDAQAISEQG